MSSNYKCGCATFIAMDTHQLSKEELMQLVQDNLKDLDKDYDEAYTVKLLDHVLGFLQEEYFRSMFIGFDPLPQRSVKGRPIIYASNHSGMSFPWDAIIFLTGLYKLNGRSLNGIARPLIAPMLARTKLLSPFLMEDLWKKVGCLEANMINFESLMNQNNYDVMIYPEGAGGISKGFEHKYELQFMSTSFVRMAVKYKTDIVSFSTVNGEYINPYSYTSKKVDALVQKLGIPFLPLGGMTPWAILQPWLAYNALPTKLTYVMGSRFKPYEMIDKPYEEISHEEFQEIRDTIKRTMQMELEYAVDHYGKKPFDLWDLAKHGIKHLGKLPYLAPSGWPVLFKEFEKQYNTDKAENFELDEGLLGFYKTLAKHPEVVPYYLPILGWVPILLLSLMQSKKKK